MIAHKAKIPFCHLPNSKVLDLGSSEYNQLTNRQVRELVEISKRGDFCHFVLDEQGRVFDPKYWVSFNCTWMDKAGKVYRLGIHQGWTEQYSVFEEPKWAYVDLVKDHVDHNVHIVPFCWMPQTLWQSFKPGPECALSDFQIGYLVEIARNRNFAYFCLQSDANQIIIDPMTTTAFDCLWYDRDGGFHFETIGRDRIEGSVLKTGSEPADNGSLIYLIRCKGN